MSINQINNLKKCARGCWQHDIINNLISQGTIINPMFCLQGKAKNYTGRYQASFNSLLSRVKVAGFNIIIQKGSKGGLWTAKYSIEC